MEYVFKLVLHLVSWFLLDSNFLNYYQEEIKIRDEEPIEEIEVSTKKSTKKSTKALTDESDNESINESDNKSIEKINKESKNECIEDLKEARDLNNNSTTNCMIKINPIKY